MNEEEEGEWTANRGPEAGCTVIMEGDPLPGAPTGRMSFQGFNTETETFTTAAELKEQEAENPGGKAVSDAEMGRQLPPHPKRRKSAGKQEGFLSPKNDTKGRYFAY